MNWLQLKHTKYVIVSVVSVRRQGTELASSPSGSVRVFEALDSDPALVKTIDAHSPVGRIVQLKVGAQVAYVSLLKTPT